MARHDLIVHNGRIRTLDSGSRVVQALGVRGGRIAAAGDDAHVLQDRAPETRVVDLGGRTVTPGFFDAHPHMDRHGLKTHGGIPIAHCRSIADIVEVVRDAAARTPYGDWIVLMPMGGPPEDYVHRSDQLREGRFPDRRDLDGAAPAHPVCIRSPWGWWTRTPLPTVLNTRALELAGITRDTPAPHNVEIVRDAAGEPTGLFLERNYTPILEYTLLACLPRFTYEDRMAGVATGAAAYAALGTTAAFEGHGNTPQIIDAWRHVHAAGELPLRIQVPLSIPTAAFDNGRIVGILHHWADALAGRGSGDDRLRIEGVCFDVGDPTVARIIGRGYPYEQWAGHFYQSLAHDRFVELGLVAARLGLRVSCLACYELERVLQAYEAIHSQVPIAERRWVIVHVTQASADQIRRIRALGLVATITPAFMTMAASRFGLGRLGPQGTPIRALLDAGIPVALSTDGVPPSMAYAMWQALARWDGDAQCTLGDSGLTREDALRLATTAGHVLTWEEDRRGPLAVGNAADFVVLGEDPLTCEEIRLRDLPVLRTFIAGRQVAGAEAGN
jgi:predicted amidohydrolase YtcJ